MPVEVLEEIASNEDTNCMCVPNKNDLPIGDDADCVYIYKNEIIHDSTQPEQSNTKRKVLVFDQSSTFFFKLGNVSDCDLIYADVQSKVNSAGMTVIII